MTTDYDYDTDDQEPVHDMWAYILIYDRDHPLTRFCIGVAVCAVIGWILTNLLT
jgi:hypothetical protein